MSAGDHITMPAVSALVSLAGALGLGGVLTALISRPSRRAVDAAAGKDEATGEAAVITATATAFIGVTTGLREEIERMQEMLDELRHRVAELEADLRAAAERELAQQRVIDEVTAQRDRALADVDRLRAGRNAANDKIIQQEGEIRQLKAVIDAQARVSQ